MKSTSLGLSGFTKHIFQPDRGEDEAHREPEPIKIATESFFVKFAR